MYLQKSTTIRGKIKSLSVRVLLFNPVIVKTHFILNSIPDDYSLSAIAAVMNKLQNESDGDSVTAILSTPVKRTVHVYTRQEANEQTTRSINSKVAFMSHGIILEKTPLSRT